MIINIFYQYISYLHRILVNQGNSPIYACIDPMLIQWDVLLSSEDLRNVRDILDPDNHRFYFAPYLYT